MANQELLTQNPAELVENQIAVTSESRLTTIINKLDALGKTEIKVPKWVQRAALAGLISTSASIGFDSFKNPGFAQTQGDAPKVEQTQNGETINFNSLSPEAQQKLIDIRGENDGRNSVNNNLKGKVKNNELPKNLIPKEVLDIDAEYKALLSKNSEIFDIGSLSPRAFQRLVDIRNVDNGFNSTNQRLKVVVKNNTAPKNLIPQEVLDIDAQDKAGSFQQPSQTTRVIEQPTQSVQAPKPPSNEGFPFLPLAIAGAAAIGGVAFYKDKILEGLSGNKKQPKRYKGKGNEQFGMPNVEPDGTNSLEMSDRIAQQKLRLEQSTQVEFLALQDLQVLEQALELAVKDGMPTNSVAYRKAKTEIDQKKDEFDKKYLS
jgi:hypothetical protein